MLILSRWQARVGKGNLIGGALLVGMRADDARVRRADEGDQPKVRANRVLSSLFLHLLPKKFCKRHKSRSQTLGSGVVNALL